MSFHKLSRETIEKQSKNFPHIETYAKCQSKAFQSGTFALVTTMAVMYVSQELLKKSLPLSRKGLIVTPIITGCLAGYAVGYYKTKQCQRMWLALEGKHTALTEMGDQDT